MNRLPLPSFVSWQLCVLRRTRWHQYGHPAGSIMIRRAFGACFVFQEHFNLSFFHFLKEFCQTQCGRLKSVKGSHSSFTLMFTKLTVTLGRIYKKLKGALQRWGFNVQSHLGGWSLMCCSIYGNTSVIIIQQRFKKKLKFVASFLWHT